MNTIKGFLRSAAVSSLLLVAPLAHAHEVVPISDPNHRLVLITIPHDHVRVAPLELDFGIVAHGTTGVESLLLQNLTAERMDVTLSEASDLLVLGASTLTLEPAGVSGELVTIDVEYSPASLADVLDAEITIVSLEQGKRFPETQRVSVIGEPGEPARLDLTVDGLPVNSGTVDFGEVTIGETWIKRLRISNVGDSATLEGHLDSDSVQNGPLNPSTGCFQTDKCFVPSSTHQGQWTGNTTFHIEPGGYVETDFTWQPGSTGTLYVPLTVDGGSDPVSTQIVGTAVAPPATPSIVLLEAGASGTLLTNIHFTSNQRQGSAPLYRQFKIKNIGQATAQVAVSGLDAYSCVNDALRSKCFYTSTFEGLDTLTLDPDAEELLIYAWFLHEDEPENASGTVIFNAVQGNDQTLTVSSSPGPGPKAMDISPDGVSGLNAMADEFAGSRGLVTDNAFFSDTDLDAVNTMNGNLVIDIPIGPSFDVGPQLSYRLNVVHNSSMWLDRTFEEGHAESDPLFASLAYTVPDPGNNVALGWRMSLGGDLYANADEFGGGVRGWPARTLVADWVYFDKSGSSHPLKALAGRPGEYFAGDGSFIRARGNPEDSGNVYIDLPNGMVQTFARYSTNCPAVNQNGVAYCRRLSRIEDPFGNAIIFQHDGDGTVSITLHSVGSSPDRQIQVKFVQETVDDIDELIDTSSGPEGIVRTRLKWVKFPRFDANGVWNQWTFTTDMKTVNRMCTVSSMLPAVFGRGHVPVLTKIDLPGAMGDTGSYDIDYYDGMFYDPGQSDNGNHASCSYVAGLVDQLVTPAKGLIDYGYSTMNFPVGCDTHIDPGDDAPETRRLVAVGSRKVVSETGQTHSQHYRYIIDDRLSLDANGDPVPGAESYAAGPDCNRPNTMQTHVAHYPPIPGTQTGLPGTNPDGSIAWIPGEYLVEVFFHTITKTEGDNLAQHGDWGLRDFGLPITKADRWRVQSQIQAGKKLYLSKVEMQCTDLTGAVEIDGCTHLRRHYKAYNYRAEHCPRSQNMESFGIGCFFWDRPVAREMTAFAPFFDGTGTQYVEKHHTDYDGYGHFRQTLTKSKLSGNLETTAYSDHFAFTNGGANQVRHTIGVEGDGGFDSDFPLVADPWNLGLIQNEYENNRDNGWYSRTFYDIASTGFMRCKRSFAQRLTPQQLEDGFDNSADNDWFTFYEDVDDDGFAEKESLGGGDASPVTALVGCPGTGNQYANYRYLKQYGYDHARLVSSTYLRRSSNGGSTVIEPFSSPLVDQTIDPWSGLVSRECDHSIPGFGPQCTDLDYDDVNRVISSIPQDDDLAKTLLDYDLLTEGGGKIRVEHKANTRTFGWTRFTQNGLGREVLAEMRVSDGRSSSGLVEQVKGYWPNGAKNFHGPLIEPGTWDSLSAAEKRQARYVNRLYDAYGRLLSFRNPADEIVGYSHDSTANKNAGMAYQTVTTAGGRVKTTLDHLRRPRQITEGVGAETRVTDVTYVDGLTTTTRSDAGVTQTRSELTDGRGAVVSMSMPEKEDLGNGADVRLEYDAMGNVFRRHEQSHTVVQTYNWAGQLEAVWNGGKLLLKNTYASHRLSKSERYNRYTAANSGASFSLLEAPNDPEVVFKVTDEPGYDDRGFMTSEQTTVQRFVVHADGSTSPVELVARLTTTYSHDESGRVVETTYPVCSSGTLCSSFSGFPQVRTKNIYDYGDLESIELSVGGAAFEPLLAYEYHASGLARAVHRFDISGIGVGEDQLTEDAQGATTMPRLGSFTFLDAGGASLLESGNFNYSPRGLLTAIGGDSYRYDTFGRLVEWTPATGSGQVYGYDDFDNLLTPADHAIGDLAIDPATNRLETITLLGQSPQPVTFDPRGNFAGFNCFESYYDALDRQIAWACTGTPVDPYRSIYIYGPSGQRIGVIDEHKDRARTEIWSPGLLRDFYLTADVAPGLKTNVDRQVILQAGDFGDGTSVALEAVHLYANHIDSIVMARTGHEAAGGENIDSYTPFGSKLGPSPERIHHAPAFAGHRVNRNSSTGNHLLDGTGLTTQTPTRGYLHILGRFLQPDPARDGWNLYAYTGNDPVNKVDPDGQAAHVLGGAAVGAVVGGGIELGYQLLFSDDPVDFQKVGAAAVSGGIVGGTAAATGGLSFLAQTGSVAIASTVGGGVARAIDGDQTTETFDDTAILTDLAIGGIAKGLSSKVGNATTQRVAGSQAQRTAVKQAESRVRAASGRAVSRQANAQARLTKLQSLPDQAGARAANVSENALTVAFRAGLDKLNSFFNGG